MPTIFTVAVTATKQRPVRSIQKMPHPGREAGATMGGAGVSMSCQMTTGAAGPQGDKRGWWGLGFGGCAGMLKLEHRGYVVEIV
ncbi:MAG: hypothetical protein Gyms2KO_31330 [Gymnodinialimonas sp.]